MSKNIYCQVVNCGRLQKAKQLCVKHYNIARKEKAVYSKCQAEGCTQNAHYRQRTLCMLHFGRWFRHGGTESKLPNYGRGFIIHEQGYKMLWIDGKYVMEHIFIAERALDKLLPNKAVVHHMNNDPQDNFTPFNLIICPDQSYHMLLHRRMKEYEQRMLLSEMEIKKQN